MKTLRIIAIIAALALMIGELWRSWGIDRPIMFVLDDQLAGGFMIAAAWAVRRDSLRNRTAFSAAWGVAVGMIYGSFFGKVFDPQSAVPGNFNLGILTALLGVAFVGALAGLWFSMTLPSGETITKGD